MTTRTHEKSVTFARSFVLKRADYRLPAGDYRVKTGEELVEGISFPVHRRIATMIFVPAQGRSNSVEMVTVDPTALRDALVLDAAGDGVVKASKI
jgi:hypothetical protein